MNFSIQYLQTSIMRDYENNLFVYYRAIEYIILLNFLSYPFRGKGCLDAYVRPLDVASTRLGRMRVLDYGAGLPFGLIYLLKTQPSNVESLTLSDLALIHAEFAKYVLGCLEVESSLHFCHLKSSEDLPNLDGRTFNCIVAKDVFEHLHKPEKTLRWMLRHAEPKCACYFDLNDHGEKHLQHVHPKLSHLNRVVVEEYGFQPNGQISSLSEFVRNA